MCISCIRFVYPSPAPNFKDFVEKHKRMVGTEFDAIDFEPEEDDLMDDDTTMDDGNADIFPTTAPKLKSTIMGGTSQLGDGDLKKTKGRGFKEETDAERNFCFATREFESLDSDGGPDP
jgi:RNA-binding protein 8A